MSGGGGAVTVGEVEGGGGVGEVGGGGGASGGGGGVATLTFPSDHGVLSSVLKLLPPPSPLASELRTAE